MKKIESFTLKQITIDRIIVTSNILGISRSELVDNEIQGRLTPMMPLVENINNQQKVLRRKFDSELLK